MLLKFTVYLSGIIFQVALSSSLHVSHDIFSLLGFSYDPLTPSVHYTETKYSSLARIQSGVDKDVTSSSSISNEKVDRTQQPVSNGVAVFAAPVVMEAENNVGHQKIMHAENGDVKTKPE